MLTAWIDFWTTNSSMHELPNDLKSKLVWDLHIRNAYTLEGFEAPDGINGSFFIPQVEEIWEKSNVPRKIAWSIDMPSVTKLPEWFEFQDVVNWDLNLSSITDVQNIKLPKMVKGTLTLWIEKIPEEWFNFPNADTIYLPYLKEIPSKYVDKSLDWHARMHQAY